MNKSHGLNAKTVHAICDVLARRPEIEEGILFGSRAKGTYRPGSDIDLALRGRHLSPGIVSRVQGDLDDLFIPYTVSLFLDDGSLDAAVHAQIEKFGISFYQKSTAIKTS